MQNSLNLRHVKPAQPLETPIEIATRYGVPLAASYRAALHFAIHLPIACLPRGTATPRDSANA